MKKVKANIVIVGGGIAGLWMLNRLNKKYSVVLIENEALGSGQTLYSQGLILPRSQEVGDVTGRRIQKVWRDCLNGFGDVDLRTSKIISDAQTLVASKGVLARMSNFMKSFKYKHLEDVEVYQEPTIPVEKEGQFYQLKADVLDMRSVLESLAKHHMRDIYKADIEEYLHEGTKLKALKLKQGGHHVVVESDVFIFTAGKGNLRALQELGIKRPQKMTKEQTSLMVKSVPFALNGAYTLSNGENMYVSSHASSEGGYVWYISGPWLNKLAETDLDRIRKMKQIVKDTFSDISFEECLWSAVHYAVPQQEDWATTKRHKVYYSGNSVVAWPANLTTVPLLADEIVTWAKSSVKKPLVQDLDLGFPQASYGLYPWESPERNWHR